VSRSQIAQEPQPNPGRGLQLLSRRISIAFFTEACVLDPAVAGVSVYGNLGHPAPHLGEFQVSAVAGVSGVLCPRDDRLSYDLAREFLPESSVKGARWSDTVRYR